MQLDKIKFLKGIKDIEIITKGYSGAYKYLFKKNNKKYFLKIGKFDVRNDLETLFSNAKIPHPTIIDFGKFDANFNYIIEEYIDGKDLKEELDKYDSKFIYEYGFKIGEKYRALRNIYPDKPMSENELQDYLSRIDERTEKLKSLIKDNGKLNKNEYEFINYIISTLKQNTHLIKNSFLVFGHTDIKPSNYLIHNKNIIATDIEYTDYKELSLSMLWTFARCDYKDEKNLAFAKGYIDALFNFDIPDSILNCFNYTYLFSLSGHCIKSLQSEEYDKLSKLIKYIKENYMIDGELKISEKLRSTINIKKLQILNGYNITLAKGSYDPYNLTFKCTKNDNSYFFKVMKISFKHYQKLIHSYNLLKKCNIPISHQIKHGCIEKNRYYYTISNFIDLKEMDKSIKNTFDDGFKHGELVASYLIKLKEKKHKKIETFDKNDLYKIMLNDIEKIYGQKENIEYIHWSKTDLINYIDNYIKSYDDEPINLIHGDVKFGNILYNSDEIYFVDNESFKYSYDIINFMYNIHDGFLKNENLCYKGFINGYLKYMNNGKIPHRIQNQVKLLLIYYVLRIAKNILDKKGDETKLKFALNSFKQYIDNDETIEWLK